MKRPLVAVVLAYSIGLLPARFFHAPLMALCLVLILLLILILVLKNHRKYLIWPLLAIVGWTNFSARTAVLSPNDLRAVVADTTPAMVVVHGTLAETPRLKIIERKGKETWRSAIKVRVRELVLTNDFRPATGELLVTVPGILGPDFFAGQPVEFTGVISAPSPPLAEGLFDYENYLATHGIYYEVKTFSTNEWKLLAPRRSTPPLTDRFLNWAQHTLALGLPGEDETLRLLWAMTLGWRAAFTGDISDPFLQAGTMHMFAIDGLRIALLSGIIVTLLRVFRLSRAWCGWIALPIIWFYTAATGWESSAIRASVMMTVVLGGWMLKRPGDLLNSLAGAALIILMLWDPRQLFEASFQLSFGVMLVIGLMLTPLNALIERVLNTTLAPDPLLAEELVPAWRKKLLAYARHIAQLGAVSFAAWMGSLPLAAKFFHLLSPVSTVANMAAVPLGTFALMANLGALICGHWLPWLTILFNFAAWFFMKAMTWVSIEFARLPGAYFYVPEPSWATILIYYAILIAIFSGWFKTARRKFVGAALLVLIAAAYLWQWQQSRAETDLAVVPLGGGHIVYVDAPDRRNDWLVNCGSRQAMDSTLKDFLRGQGVNHVPRLVLADGNSRNCGGAERLSQLFGIGEIWTSEVTFRSPAYIDAIVNIDQASHKIFSPGETNGCWRILFPPATVAKLRAEDAPLVMLGNFHGTRILLLSELSRDGQSHLLGLVTTNDLRADIVIAGLPDKGQPLCDDLIAAVQPHVIVIADSEYPVTRRADTALHDRLDQTQIPVIYTRTSGEVKISANKTGWHLHTMDGQEFAGH